MSDSAIPWTVAYQAPLSMGFSRQEYWSGLPYWSGLLFPSPGDLPDPGIEPGFLALETDALTSEPPGKPRVAHNMLKQDQIINRFSIFAGILSATSSFTYS